jgi:c-di-GMP-binding flagellar brake protein YcgR
VAGRRAKRFTAPTTIPVAFQGGSTRFTANVVDISTTGILLRCEEDIELGTMGKMAIPVGHETSRVLAVAKRRLPGVGVAFEFTHMSARDRELLRRLLLRLASVPEP